MATTRYIVAATPQREQKTMSNLKSAKREADLRAKGAKVPVTVTTEATGRTTYTAVPLTPQPAASTVDAFAEALAEVQQEAAAKKTPAAKKETKKAAPKKTAPKAAAQPAPQAADDKPKTAKCGCLVADILTTGEHSKRCTDAPARKQQAKAVERDQPVRPARTRTGGGGGGRRETQGDSVVPGYGLLYDKPKQEAQVGRTADGKYALICTRHNHAHPLERLLQERGLRSDKRRAWCPECSK